MLNAYSSQVGFYILIAIGCLAVQVQRADAQLIGLGGCPNVNVVSNFNITQASFETTLMTCLKFPPRRF